MINLPEGPLSNSKSEHTREFLKDLYANGDRITLSYSQITTYNMCRRMWYWEQICDLTPKGKSFPLQVGDITHRLLDLWHKGQLNIEILSQLTELVQELSPDNERELSVEVAAEAAGLFDGYLRYFTDDKDLTISPEVHVELDLNEFYLYSRLDALAEGYEKAKDKKVRIEYKTAKRMDSGYLKGYRKGLQTGISHWMLEELYPNQIWGSLYRMLVRTQTPSFYESPVRLQPYIIHRAQQTVMGTWRQIKGCDIYPSMQCMPYNRECPYDILCRKDTPQNRQDFFTSRKEVKAQKPEILRIKSTQTIKEDEE